MKKFASMVASAALIGGGLVAASPATAAPEGQPYPGSIDTRCNADNLNNPRRGGNARVKLNVRPEFDGGQEVRGRVTFAYVKRSNRTVVAEFRRLYRGPGRINYSFSGLPRSRYIVKVFFNSRPDNSVYSNCSDRFTQRVRPRR